MENIEIKINSNATKATNEMSLFRKEIQELRGQLLKLDEGTEEYNKTLSKLSNKQFQLREMNENVRYTVTDLGEQLSTVARITGGVVAGFSAVQGAVQLFGGESENLQKTMVKLQAAMAIVQGLQGLEGLGEDLRRAKIQFSDAIKAVKGFITGLHGMKAALVATGIGALVVALGMIVAYWDEIAKLWNGGVAEEMARANESLQSTYENLDRELMQENIKATYRYANTLRKLGGDAEAAAKALQKYNDELDENNLNNLNKKLDQAADVRLAALLKHMNLSEKQLKDENNKIVKAYKEADKAYEEAKQKRDAAAGNIAKKKAEREQQELQQQKKRQQEELKQQQELYKQEQVALIKYINDTENTIKRELAEINKLDDKIRIFNLSPEDAEIDELKTKLRQATELYEKWGLDTEHVEKYYKALIDQVKNKYDLEEINNQLENIDNTLENKLNTLSTQDDGYSTGKVTPEEAYNNQLAIDNAILQAEREAYDQKKLLIEEELKDLTLSDEQKIELQQALTDNEIALNNAVLENKKKNDKSEELLDKRKLAVKKATLSSTAQILSEMSNLVGENTAAGKAMAVSSALINTYLSATGAFNSAVNPPAFGPASPAVGALFAAAAVTQGLAQVKQILSVDENGTTSIGGSGDVTSTPNVTAGMMPTEIFGQQLSDMTEFEVNQGESEMKVVVLESDITKTQNKVKTQVSESTF